jgi:hypothetical protein
MFRWLTVSSASLDVPYFLYLLFKGSDTVFIVLRSQMARFRKCCTLVSGQFCFM